MTEIETRVTILEQQAIATHETLGLIDRAVRDGDATVIKEVRRLNGEIVALNRWRWMTTGGGAVLVFGVATFGVYVLSRL